MTTRNEVSITPEAVADVAKVVAARPSQSDIVSAMPAENAVVSRDARGNERVDFKGVKIKNADGTLNKYGRRMIEMHRKQAQLSAELSAKVSSTVQTETLIAGDGRRMQVPARLAEAVAKARGLRPHVSVGGRVTSRTVCHADGTRTEYAPAGKGRALEVVSQTFKRPDGTIVRFERRGGKMVEVEA